jgi:hypothetical protein
MTKTEAYQDSIQFLGLTKKNGVGVGELYALKPTNNGGNFVWSRALSAYRTNQEGVMELVASGTPRVDYTNTCPELLIEKASTNKLLQSETFNTSWTAEKLTITNNAVVAPNGLTVADSLVPTVVSGVHRIQQAKAVAGQVGTMYVYAKANGYNWIALENGGEVAYFNISTGVVGTVSAGTATMKLVNGFYQCIFTCTGLNTKSNIYIASADNTVTFTGNGTSGVYLWGSQFEQSTYATSYIPTTTASVTRPQDKAYNTTIAYGLKGTIFIRARIFSSTYTKVDTLFSLNDETLDDYITCSTNASRSIFITTMGGAIDTNSYNYSLASDGIYSIAIGYDFTGVNNKVNIAINGVLKRANAAQTNNPPVALSRFDLGSLYETLPSVDNRIIGQMYFADQLSDTDLTALTVQ